MKKMTKFSHSPIQTNFFPVNFFIVSGIDVPEDLPIAYSARVTGIDQVNSMRTQQSKYARAPEKKGQTQAVLSCFIQSKKSESP